MRIAALLAQSFEVPVTERVHKTLGRECCSELFYLCYTITNKAFIIEDLSVTFHREGHGRKLIKLVWSFCEQRNLDLYAKIVLLDAVDFWLAMGLERDPMDPANFVRRYQKQAA